MKSSCGYYGWTGTNLIFSEVLELFPEKELNVAPIPYYDFVELVLVPETAVCLIAEDFKLNLDDNYEEVLKIYDD